MSEAHDAATVERVVKEFRVPYDKVASRETSLALTACGRMLLLW